MDARIRSRINSLTALIEHKKTSDIERAAAEHLLAKVYKAHDITPGAKTGDADGSSYYRLPERVYGDKHAETKGLSLTEIAKLMRADIKLMRKAAKLASKPGDVALIDPLADAPAEIRISITTSYGSTSGSINIRIKNVPEGWGWTMKQVNGYPAKVGTAALKAYVQAINDVFWSYNYDGSDASVDYFDRRFWGHVSAEDIIVSRWDD